MKKLIISLVVIIFVVESCSQKTSADAFYPPKNIINKNIILVGIAHDKDSNTLLDDSSRQIFCSIFPELLKESAGKPIIFLIEGIPDTISGHLNPRLNSKLGLPECIVERYTFIGCDNRSGTFEPQFIDALHTIFYFAYDDEINGQEKSIEESFKKASALRLDRLDSADKENTEFWGTRMGENNKEFEDLILHNAQILEKKGYYVVIFCGAVHAVKISMQKRVGYLICTKNSSDLLRAIKSAKILALLEKK